ncbi:hypothetical protein Trydic_g8498 [Trypoxylus dichotomus]
MRAAIPTMKGRCAARTGFWTEELGRLRASVRRHRRKYQRAVVERGRKIEEARIRSWHSFLDRYMGTDLWGMPYKIVFSALRRENGSSTRGWRESAEMLMTVLLPDDVRQDEIPPQIALKDGIVELRPNQRLEEPFTEGEVHAAILRLRGRKALGPDNTPSEVLQQIAPRVVPALTGLYNECFRRDATDHKSHRPICLLDNLGNVFKRLLCARLREHCERRGKHAAQYAYRQGRSTEDTVKAALKTVERLKTKYVIGVFVDIAGAFDNLWWPALFARLRRIGCPPALYKCFRSYCQDRYVIMRCPGQRIQKKVTKGCPQSSICGPEFWDITMEGLLQDLDEVPELEKALAYADDLLLIIAANSRRHLEERANIALSRLARWCDAQKLQISTGKTTFPMLRGSMQRIPLIRLRGRTLRRQVVTRYLGIHMGERGSFGEHITQTCYKATATMQKIARMARNHYSMPMKNIRAYMTSVMTSIVTYGASVWAHN